MYVLGDVVYSVYALTPSGVAPFPNVGDAAYLIF